MIYEDILSVAWDVLRAEAEAIRAQEMNLGQDFVRTVEDLIGVQGRIILTGMGKSGHVAARAAATLSSTGTRAAYMHSAEALHGDLGMVGPHDALVAVSASGETRETVEAARAVGLRYGSSLPIIAITRWKDSSLGRLARRVLRLGTAREGCPLGLAPMSSLAETSSLLDAIAACLMSGRGFTRANFARLHPAGSLGIATTAIKEVMRAGERCPRVAPGDTILQAVLQMTHSRLGAVAVVQDGKVAGVITDGDIRRRIEKGFDPALPCSTIMTQSAVTIGQNRPVAEAVDLMASRECDMVLVLDAAGQLAGVIDERDVVFSGRWR